MDPLLKKIIISEYYKLNPYTVERNRRIIKIFFHCTEYLHAVGKVSQKWIKNIEERYEIEKTKEKIKNFLK